MFWSVIYRRLGRSAAHIIKLGCPAIWLKIPDWSDWAIETRFWGLPDPNPLLVSLSLQYYSLLATQSVKLLPNALWTCSIQDSVFRVVHLADFVSRDLKDYWEYGIPEHSVWCRRQSYDSACWWLFSRLKKSDSKSTIKRAPWINSNGTIEQFWHGYFTYFEWTKLYSNVMRSHRY